MRETVLWSSHSFQETPRCPEMLPEVPEPRNAARMGELPRTEAWCRDVS